LGEHVAQFARADAAAAFLVEDLEALDEFVCAGERSE
jgi:hypothetical protein